MAGDCRYEDRSSLRGFLYLDVKGFHYWLLLPCVAVVALFVLLLLLLLQPLVRQPPATQSQEGGILSRLFGTPKAKPKASVNPPPSVGDTQFRRLRSGLHSTADSPSVPQPKRARAEQPSAKPGSSGRGTAVVPAQPPLAKRLERCGIDPKLLSTVLESVVTRDQMTVTWDDVTGLEDAKQALFEAVILPLQRPDLFTGLRAPTRGILLFGPPGTGKTFLAKACACTGGATFFSLSASTLTSKYVGEGEKLVKAMFMAAQELQPAIIFLDEIDSLLTARSETENEASRRLKTEFMVQMEGLSAGGGAGHVLCLGATNRPFELDDAILRRFPKRLLLPLPDLPTRERLFVNLVHAECTLSDADYRALATATEGYSSSDITNVCREALMMPIRELGPAAASVAAGGLRSVKHADFLNALKTVRPSASRDHLEKLKAWNASYGSA